MARTSDFSAKQPDLANIYDLKLLNEVLAEKNLERIQ
jgi:hypothetical protein